MAELNDDGKAFHLDEVLGQLGTFGRHQVATLAMLALVYATNSMYNVNYVFAVEDVNYRSVELLNYWRCSFLDCHHHSPNKHTEKKAPFWPITPGLRRCRPGFFQVQVFFNFKVDSTLL